MLASHEDGRCLIQFAKTPMSLVLAQTTHTNWLIQFPPARMSFSGRRQPPTRFAWLYLYAALSGQQLASPFRFEREPDGGWRLENPRSGDARVVDLAWFRGRGRLVTAHDRRTRRRG